MIWGDGGMIWNDGGMIWSDTKKIQKKIQKNNSASPFANAAGAGGIHNAEKGVTITISAFTTA